MPLHTTQHLTISQQVHLKMQDLSKKYDQISLDLLVQELGFSNGEIKHSLQQLLQLDVLSFEDSGKEYVALTVSGKLWNIPWPFYH